MYLIILSLLILNLIILFYKQLKISMSILVIISNIILIIFLLLTINNIAILKLAIITTIIYCILLTFIISSSSKNLYVRKKINYNIIYLFIILILSTLPMHYIIKKTYNNTQTTKSNLIKNKIISKNINKSYESTEYHKKNTIFSRFGEFIVIICSILPILLLRKVK